MPEIILYTQYQNIQHMNCVLSFVVIIIIITTISTTARVKYNAEYGKHARQYMVSNMV